MTHYIFTNDLYSQPIKFGFIQPLSLSRQLSHNGTSISNKYAIFGGGSDLDRTALNIVDVYNTDWSRITPEPLSVGRQFPTVGSIGSYILFAGGHPSGTGWSSPHSSIDAYNEDLIRTSSSSLSLARYLMPSARTNRHIIFAGGMNTSVRNVVDAYDENLTRSILATLNPGRDLSAGTSLGTNALFAGGRTQGDITSALVDVYDKDLVKTTIPIGLSQGRCRLSASSINNFAIFAGGEFNINANYTNIVEAFDTNFTRYSLDPLYSNSTALSGALTKNKVLFAGGRINSIPISIVTSYDLELSRKLEEDLTSSRANMSAVTLGDYALFAGGMSFTETEDRVDVYDEDGIQRLTSKEF